MIWIKQPMGTIPAQDAKNLAPNQAQTAENCDLQKGTWRPIGGLTKQGTSLSNTIARTIFKNGDAWLDFTADTDVVKSPVQETKDRYYYTAADIAPKAGDDDHTDGSEVDLGVPAPVGAITATPTSFCTASGVVLRTSSYCITAVNEWGEESGPSIPTGPVGQDDNEYIQFSDIERATISFISYFRIYRSAAGDADAFFFLLPYQTSAGTIQYEDPETIGSELNSGNLTIGKWYKITARTDAVFTDDGAADNNVDTVFLASDNTVTLDADNKVIEVTGGTSVLYDIPIASADDARDNVLDSQLGEALPSSYWQVPPVGLQGLTYAGNGVLAGFKEKTVYFAEPWIFSAWSSKYEYVVSADVVGLGHVDGQIFAMTTDGVTVFHGDGPGYLAPKDLPEPQGCVSKRSIVSTKYGVLYASKDGLCLANFSGIKVLTYYQYTRDDWLDLLPSTNSNLVGVYYNGAYYGFKEGEQTGFRINIESEEPTIITFDLGNSYDFYGAHYDPASDNLYLSLHDGSQCDLYTFDSDDDNPLTMTWKSKNFFDRYRNYPALLIVGDSGSSTVTIWADGTKKLDEVSVTHNSMRRLPSGFKAREWEVQVVTTTKIEAIGLGSPKELAHAA